MDDRVPVVGECVEVEAIFHEGSGTLTYMVWDEETRDAILIDTVLDFDSQSIRFSTESLESIYERIEARQLCVRAVLDTHVHADHFSGMAEVKTRYGCWTVIGSGIRRVQEIFVPLYGIQDACPTDGSQFDRLMAHEEDLCFGSITVRALHTPGHTPACTCYLVGDMLFTGDAMFMPDFGTGRCDFPDGSAGQLYDSVMNRLYTLPPDTRVFVGHDYQPGGRELRFETTIAECAENNIRLSENTARLDFVEWRTDRDAQLHFPKLLFSAIQVNIDAGRLPRPTNHGIRYLKHPIAQLGPSDV